MGFDNRFKDAFKDMGLIGKSDISKQFKKSKDISKEVKEEIAKINKLTFKEFDKLSEERKKPFLKEETISLLQDKEINVLISNKRSNKEEEREAFENIIESLEDLNLNNDNNRENARYYLKNAASHGRQFLEGFYKYLSYKYNANLQNDKGELKTTLDDLIKNYDIQEVLKALLDRTDIFDKYFKTDLNLKDVSFAIKIKGNRAAHSDDILDENYRSEAEMMERVKEKYRDMTGEDIWKICHIIASWLYLAEKHYSFRKSNIERRTDFLLNKDKHKIIFINKDKPSITREKEVATESFIKASM